MLQAPNTPKAYTINGFCQQYAASRRTVYREIHAGRLKAVKRGYRTIITAEAAQAWLEALPDFSAAA